MSRDDGNYSLLQKKIHTESYKPWVKHIFVNDCITSIFRLHNIRVGKANAIQKKKFVPESYRLEYSHQECESILGIKYMLESQFLFSRIYQSDIH